MTQLKNYGRVKMNLLKRTDLSPRKKMIHVLISAKQGTTDHAKLTNRQIADALGISIQYVDNTIKELERKRLLKIIKTKGKLSVTKYATKNKQYGEVETDMLITQNISLYGKYLYTIYCVVGNRYDSNIWSRDSICREFKMGKDKYYEAHSELLDKGVLETRGLAKGNGIQTSNLNTICRAENYDIQKPKSWLKKNFMKVDLSHAGWNVNFPKVVYTPKTLVGDEFLYENIGRGQPEANREDNLNESEGTSEVNDTGQRTLTNITLTNTSRSLNKRGLTNQTVSPDWLMTEEGKYYFGEYLSATIDYDSSAQDLFEAIYNMADKYSKKNLDWIMSEKDEEYLYDILRYWDVLYDIPFLIGEGFSKCMEKEDWRFGKIIYRAHAAVMNYEIQGYGD